MQKAVGIWLILALVLAAQAAFAQADAKTEAKGHFEAGLALFKAEKYEAAMLELEASVKLYSTKSGLFNLANVYKILSRYDDTVATLDRLEKEHGAALDEEMKSVMEKMRAEIKTLAARLEVTVEPAGASVTVDGREVGKSPLLRPVLVDPGEHVVSAALEGYSTAESTVNVISKQTAKVRLALDREVGAAPAPVAVPVEGEPDEGPVAEPAAESESKAPETEDLGGPAAEEDGKKPLRPVWFWAGLGATVAFGGVALGMDLAVRSNKDDLVSTSELDRNEGMQKTGIAFIGLAGAAAVTTAVLAGFTEFRKEDETPVAVGVSPSGVVVMGRF